MTALPPSARWDECDPGNRMLAWIKELPDQIRDAAAVWPQGQPAGEITRGVVAVAMGGSAMAAQVALTQLPPQVPGLVVRSDALPGWVGPGWLLAACSYSGNTRETLSCFTAATQRGCSMASVSAGGVLQEQADARGILHRNLQAGQPPRTAVGQAVVGILWVLWVHGLVEDPRGSLHAAETTLRTLWMQGLGASDPWSAPCGLIAQAARETYIMVVGAGITMPAAVRWSQQLNENAKCPCFALEVPEMLHNHVEALEAAARGGSVMVTLKDRGHSYAEAASLDYLGSVFSSFGGTAFRVDSRGEGTLERIFSLMYLGDQVSYLASLLRGMDPTPVERIGHLKKVIGSG